MEQVALKKPDARMLARLNPITPFEDATSLEFLSERNDASLLLIGSNSKKRPNNLVFVRRVESPCTQVAWALDPRAHTRA